MPKAHKHAHHVHHHGPASTGKSHVLVGILMGIVIGVGGFFAWTTYQKQQTTVRQQANKTVDFLFLQQAEAGKLTPVSSQKDVYTLSLTNVSPRTLFLDAQPNSSFTSISSDKFLSSVWNANANSSFAKQPPTGSLTAYDGEKNTVSTYTFIMNNPQYSFASNTLTYTVTLTNPSPTSSNPTDAISDATQPAKSFSSPSLYIDVLGGNTAVAGKLPF